MDSLEGNHQLDGFKRPLHFSFAAHQPAKRKTFGNLSDSIRSRQCARLPGWAAPQLFVAKGGKGHLLFSL